MWAHHVTPHHFQFDSASPLPAEFVSAPPRKGSPNRNKLCGRAGALGQHGEGRLHLSPAAPAVRADHPCALKTNKQCFSVCGEVLGGLLPGKPVIAFF